MADDGDPLETVRQIESALWEEIEQDFDVQIGWPLGLGLPPYLPCALERGKDPWVSGYTGILRLSASNLAWDSTPRRGWLFYPKVRTISPGNARVQLSRVSKALAKYFSCHHTHAESNLYIAATCGIMWQSGMGSVPGDPGA